MIKERKSVKNYKFRSEKSIDKNEKNRLNIRKQRKAEKETEGNVYEEKNICSTTVCKYGNSNVCRL